MYLSLHVEHGIPWRLCLHTALSTTKGSIYTVEDGSMVDTDDLSSLLGSGARMKGHITTKLHKNNNPQSREIQYRSQSLLNLACGYFRNFSRIEDTLFGVVKTVWSLLEKLR